MGSLFVGLLLLVALLAAIALATIVLLARQRGSAQGTVACPVCSMPVGAGDASCSHCDHPLQSAPDADSPRLIAVQGSLVGREFNIPPPPKGLTIGRASANHVALADDVMVSRHHAQIMQENGHHVLHDRDSVNGVFVNNQRIARHVLADRDMIQICNAFFRFVVGAAPDSTVPRPTPPAPPVSDSMHLPAQTEFEGYVLEEELGRGGMSVVYKARDAQGATYAIKVLDVSDKYLRRKFVQEGEIGAALRDHPHIRVVHHLSQSQDQNLYLVMEYIQGQSLRKLTEQGIADTEIVRLIGEVCDALHYAHQQNIVHRDIKPENILVDHHGAVKVTDFGIAKLTSSVTVTNDRIVGTPEYLSPEQAQGRQRILPASDVYSLGIVLYEMLAGRPPFPLPPDLSPREATVIVLTQHIEDRPTRPGQIRSRVSKRLEKVALKALEKAPQQRFPTAQAMAQALGFDSQVIPPPPLIRPVAHLVVVRGSHARRHISLASEMTLLGREQIAPDDRQMSRQHLSIAPRGGQLWLQDRSLNGTWVNGERVYGQTPLNAGDEIIAGNHVLRLETGSPRPQDSR